MLFTFQVVSVEQIEDDIQILTRKEFEKFEENKKEK